MIRALLTMVLVSFLSCSAYAATSTTVRERYAFVGEKTCGINGQLEFALTEFKGNLDVRDIKGVGMKYNNSKSYVPVPGKWYDEEYAETRVFRKGEKTIFVSNESFFKNPGNYTILLANKNVSDNPLLQINYYTGKNTLEDGSGLQFSVTCPKVTHLCMPANLQIDSCNLTPKAIIVKFRGLKNAKLDLTRDIEYTLNYERHADSISYQLLPNTTRIIPVAADTYRLEIDANSTKEPVSSIRIRVKDCNDKLYKTNAYKSCSAPKRLGRELTANKSIGGNATDNRLSASITNLSQPAKMPSEEKKSVENTSIKKLSEQKKVPEQAAQEPKGWLGRLLKWFRSFF